MVVRTRRREYDGEDGYARENEELLFAPRVFDLVCSKLFNVIKRIGKYLLYIIEKLYHATPLTAARQIFESYQCQISPIAAVPRISQSQSGRGFASLRSSTSNYHVDHRSVKLSPIHGEMDLASTEIRHWKMDLRDALVLGARSSKSAYGT
ncbi:hypothetical protein K0M31_018664 [Melipona bicolor]|uniref:Uncharacterized protein n=1 Tax=Melipona bicolor TaxID=60889 RepID=A0AA40KRW8_9HYME|nr:hypothetical protein K0M31_018664 [Melipona bicolor]